MDNGALVLMLNFGFSFRCGSHYHAPTDCETIRQWLTKCADDSETANYISAHTKVTTTHPLHLISSLWFGPYNIVFHFLTLGQRLFIVRCVQSARYASKRMADAITCSAMDVSTTFVGCAWETGRLTVRNITAVRATKRIPTSLTNPLTLELKRPSRNTSIISKG